MPGLSFTGHVRQFSGENMKIRQAMTWVAVASIALLSSASQAEELCYSGFMTDYTQLRKVTDGSVNYRYVAPGVHRFPVSLTLSFCPR